ncbi:hypothetical protein C0992_007471 [Termitomyces sp. T32_za158]|nr:hypothetical protein C0992_007471 [Termitomyces sp. T32_za158]
MSTTTQILFNSPALHSLKRDQLIKLCKIHNIKASGKNTELIEKLKKVAETLPKDAPLSIAARSESLADNSVGDEGDETVHDATQREQLQSANARWVQMPRPSEQWDVVMENIEEVDEKSSQGTLNSLRTIGNGGSGEFGTVISQASSSLEFLTSSFGSKRGIASEATTSSNSFPRSSSFTSPLQISPIPSGSDSVQTSHHDAGAHPHKDHFNFHSLSNDPIPSTNNHLPLPGHSLRPGVPAPSDARLSLGLNEPSTPTRDRPTTTIRLISSPALNNESYGRTPQLLPFKTSFDLDFGSPQPSGGFRGITIWPPNEGQQKKGIYPRLPLEDLADSFQDGLGPVSFAKSVSNDVNVDASTSDLLASAKTAMPSLLPHTLKSTTTTQLAVHDDPFIFGSPLPQHKVSDSQFKSAAASVLEEMNKRLRQDGVDGIGMDLVTKLQPGAHAAGMDNLGPPEKAANKTKIHKEKFDRLHEEEFSKLEGIDSLVKRRGLLAKEREGPGLVVKNRKSAIGVAGHGIGRDRFGRRIGGESGRLSAATMVNESRERRRSRVIPGAFGEDDNAEEETETRDEDAELSSKNKEDHRDEDKMITEENGEKAETEEEHKHKEREAIKKKLEITKARRKSSAAGARGRVSIGRGQVVKPQSVARPKPSRFGFLSSARSLVAKVWGGGRTATSAAIVTTSRTPKPTTTKSYEAAPALAPAPAPPKKALAPVCPSTATTVNRVRSFRGEKDNATAIMSSTTASHSQLPLPLPSMTPPLSNTRGTTKSGTGASGQWVSTLETRSSLSSTGRSSSSATVGSMSSKKSVTVSGSRSSSSNVTSVAAAAIGSSSSRLSSSKLSTSRLLAPTASSLAKAIVNKPSVSGLKVSLKGGVEGSVTQIWKSQASGSDKFSMITNSPRMPRELRSPHPKRIFSKPLAMPCGIPTLTRKHHITTTEDDAMEKEDVKEAEIVTAPIRQRSLNGRKPRISRSKVIAKLASQRAASASRPGSTPGAKAGRTRSSLGVKGQRSSYGGKSVGVKGVEDSVLMSAKKRVRQSEYARRKSHAASIDPGKVANTMDIDGE